MENKKIIEGVNKTFPINEDREPIHPFNQHQFLRREGFRKGVEWALKQVKNNGVLDGVIKRFEVGKEVIWKDKPFYVVEEKDAAILVSNGLELDDELYCDWWVNKSEVNVL